MTKDELIAKLADLPGDTVVLTEFEGSVWTFSGVTPNGRGDGTVILEVGDGWWLDQMPEQF